MVARIRAIARGAISKCTVDWFCAGTFMNSPSDAPGRAMSSQTSAVRPAFLSAVRVSHSRVNGHRVASRSGSTYNERLPGMVEPARLASNDAARSLRPCRDTRDTAGAQRAVTAGGDLGVEARSSDIARPLGRNAGAPRSEEHTSEL